MDIATIIGLVIGIGTMAYSVMGGSGGIGAFVDYPSLVCVIGGAVAAVFLCFPLKRVASIGKVGMKVLINRQDDPHELIETLVSLAETARRDGLLALEGQQAEIKNPFMRLGIQMTVDGTRPEVIEDVLRTEIEGVATRHRDGKAVLDQMGRFAPAFGMIGTLLGLVIMLGNMSDPDAIGPGMAVALLTTLYGAVVSNLFCLPFAEKLGYINREELLAMEIILRGVLGIQAGDNPRVIQQKLSTFLPPRQRGSGKEAA